MLPSFVTKILGFISKISTSLTLLFFFAYAGFLFQNFYVLFYPEVLSPTDTTTKGVSNLYKYGDAFDIYVYVSPLKEACKDFEISCSLLWEQKNVTYSPDMLDIQETAILPQFILDQAYKTQTMSVHIYGVVKGSDLLKTLQNRSVRSQNKLLYRAGTLTKFMKPLRTAHNLLTGVSNVTMRKKMKKQKGASGKMEEVEVTEASVDPEWHLATAFNFAFVLDDRRYASNMLPGDVRRYFRHTKDRKNYFPIIYQNEFWLRRADFYAFETLKEMQIEKEKKKLGVVASILKDDGLLDDQKDLENQSDEKSQSSDDSSTTDSLAAEVVATGESSSNITAETNSTTEKGFRVQITFSGISLGKFRLLHQFTQAIELMKTQGMSDADFDAIRDLLTRYSPTVFILMIVVSMIHMLFDVLAFKNDVSHWKKRKNMQGISSRAVVLNTVSQIIVFLYLYDNDTSLLVVVPVGIQAAIDIWKLKKALRISVVSYFPPKIDFGTVSKEEQETEDADNKATKYMTRALLPLMAGYSIYSLVYDLHRGWYSWILSTLTGYVYAFGFILMMPQLFINYRLKSVAHLPWRAMVYKAFNTFIDDVFAFVIQMPTMHRMACFRDDLIFFCFLYQLYIYPVDHTRVNEYGMTGVDEGLGTEEEKEALKKEQQQEEEELEKERLRLLKKNEEAKSSHAVEDKKKNDDLIDEDDEVNEIQEIKIQKNEKDSDSSTFDKVVNDDETVNSSIDTLTAKESN